MHICVIFTILLREVHKSIPKLSPKQLNELSQSSTAIRFGIDLSTC